MTFVHVSSGRAAALRITAAVALTVIASVARAEEPQIRIDNFTFEPQTMRVEAGTTITWRNDDDIPHAIASSTRLFKSKALDTGDTFSYTFTTPGSYEYFCSLHPHMTATIVVESKTGRK